MKLEDLPLDVGYASERVTLLDEEKNPHAVGGQNGQTQLFITTPFIDEAFLGELAQINKLLPHGGDFVVTATLIVANDAHKNPHLEKIAFLMDAEGEFGDFYGVRLLGEPYDFELTKALILISKDGAIFYDEFVQDLSDSFNLDTLLRKITAAQICYTGKGCHE
jgi:thiol peroxidase